LSWLARVSLRHPALIGAPWSAVALKTLVNTLMYLVLVLPGVIWFFG